MHPRQFNRVERLVCRRRLVIGRVGPGRSCIAPLLRSPRERLRGVRYARSCGQHDVERAHAALGCVVDLARNRPLHALQLRQLRSVPRVEVGTFAENIRQLHNRRDVAPVAFDHALLGRERRERSAMRDEASQDCRVLNPARASSHPSVASRIGMTPLNSRRVPTPDASRYVSTMPSRE